MVEIALRLADYPPTVRSGWRSHARPGELNQLGFRGQAIEYFDDDVVVVILGGSQGEAAALPFESMPERRLEAHLKHLRPGKRFRVFTLGASGYGNDQQLLVLREYFARYRADLVLLWQTPTNDIIDNMFPTHLAVEHDAKPTFWLEQGELRGPSEQLGQRRPAAAHDGARRKSVPGRPGRRLGSGATCPSPITPSRTTRDRWTRNGAQMRARGVTLVNDERLESERVGLPALAHAPQPAASQYGLDLTHALLAEIAAECASRGSRFTLVHNGLSREKGPVSPYIVNMAQDEVVRELNGRRYRISNTQFWTNLRYMNRGLPYTFVRVTTPDWRLSPTDGHLNAVATDQVMHDLAQQLLNLAQPSAPSAGVQIAAAR